MKYESTQQNNASFQITHRDELLQEEINVKFLGLEIDKYMNWKIHTELCYPNWTVNAMWLDAWSFVAILKLLRWYIMHTQSASVYGIIFWGNSTESNKIFLQHKTNVRTILGINPWSSWKPHFKTMGILTMPSQYILSLMEFLVNNLAYFSLNSEIHNKLTRKRRSLHVLPVNLSLYQKGV